jgi:hypothetical protein
MKRNDLAEQEAQWTTKAKKKVVCKGEKKLKKKK